jgi:thiamine-monophosphate kinase
MIDISDGLASEILHLCTASDVGCDIYEEKIPIDPTTVSMAHTFGIDPATCALNGGEDYELLFSISTSDYERIKDEPDISVIGHFKEKESGVNLVTRSGSLIPITAQGWDAFRKLKSRE